MIGNSQAELGNNDFTLLSFTDSTGLQPRVSYSSHPVNSSRTGAFARKARDTYEGGDKKFIRKRGYREGEGTTPSSVYFTDVPCPKKDGSMRPVFNLKGLNQFIHWEHFKMENVQTIRDLIQEGD